MIAKIESLIFFLWFSANRSDKTLKKPYDAARFADKPTSPTAIQLQEKVKLLEMDYKALHDKRLQDVRNCWLL